MKNVLSSLAKARLWIKSQNIAKDGKNTFSKYDYFSPEFVSKMVNDACIEADIISIFNLKSDQFGFFGEVVTTDLESGEELITILRTAKPSITATNETQQMGGMATYAKRYCLMSLFDIEDNTIDFDAHDNTKKEQQPTNTNNTQEGLPWLNENSPQYAGAIAKLKAGTTTWDNIQKAFKVSKAIKEKINAAVKS